MKTKYLDKIQSPLEELFLDDCIACGMTELEAQYEVANIHADFAIPSKKLVIELDSKMWHTDEQSFINDSKRDNIYHRNGYGVLRISGGAIYKDGPDIIERINRGEFNGMEGHTYWIN